jgi:outer membrane protein OmpA-like peptidoglycan-associated protein
MRNTEYLYLLEMSAQPDVRSASIKKQNTKQADNNISIFKKLPMFRSFPEFSICSANIPTSTRIALVFLITLLCSNALLAQNFHKDKAKYYRNAYKRTNPSYANACDLLKKKRKSTKNRPVPTLATGARKKSSKPTPMAEVALPVTASAKPISVVPTKPVAKITTPNATSGKPTFSPSPIVSKQTLDKMHNKEDDVLKLNHLPTPTSEKHEEIRRLVSNTLTNKKDSEPIELEPLYFTFDQDEFSVVDMDPFLVAVEFALQGKHILIEGHTDHQGNDDYNVQLSIKRVEKLRQLMRDMGVSDDQISVVGYGEEVVDHRDKSEDGRQLNRRVDFKAF